MLNYHDVITRCPPRSGGFTLIDLMIVFAVVAILVALAMPFYQDYAIRTKVTGCIFNAAPAKLSISEYRAATGAWPPDAKTASLTQNGWSGLCNGYVSYDSATGSFQLNINESVLGKDIGQLQPQLTPRVTNIKTVIWACSMGETDESSAKYLPPACREG